MARSRGTAVDNNFTGGLVTEATALNFPENAVTYTDNCVFDKTGAVYRRPGIDLEFQQSTLPIGRGQEVIGSYLWKAVAGDGRLTFVVVQIGNFLLFYKSAQDSISKNKFDYIFNLTSFSTAGAEPGQYECQFASGNGYLFVTNPKSQPFYVEFDVPTSTFSASVINIEIRDFVGAQPDDLDLSDTYLSGGGVGTPGWALLDIYGNEIPGEFEGPGIPLGSGQGVVAGSNGGVPRSQTLTEYHRYNLANQGWPDDKRDIFKRDVRGWPLNTDVWWLLKDADGQFKPGPIEIKTAQKDQVVTTYGDIRANSIYRGNTPAPKGHFVFNAFNQNRNGLGFNGTPVTTSGAERPSCVGFFTGRVFYSGVNANGFADKIYFSQIIEGEDQFGKCYQTNDPTSEVEFNLLPSDGGVISIPDAGTIYRMHPIGGSLIVFASNGIWSISGSSGIGFSASDYSVSKASTININSFCSFVDIEGYPSFWNDEGIYLVSTSQVGNIQVQSISDKKIKSFFKEIPQDSKRFARGYYNPLDKTVQWVYRSTQPFNTIDNYTFDRVLVFNTQIESFYTWSITQPDSSRFIVGVITSYGTSTKSSESIVTTNSLEFVVDSANTPITVETTAYSALPFKYKYLTFTDTGFTFSETKEDQYLDWGTYNYKSEFITGYRIRGEGHRESEVNYLTVYFGKEYGNQFAIQALWDYSTSGNTGRWSSNQVINAGRGQYTYDSRRIKIRGHGKALQFKFKSVANNPFNIQGWVSMDFTNNDA